MSGVYRCPKCGGGPGDPDCGNDPIHAEMEQKIINVQFVARAVGHDMSREDAISEVIAEKEASARFNESFVDPITKSWYFTLTSDKYGESRLGGYDSKAEAQDGIRRIKAAAKEFKDGVKREFSKPMQEQ